MQNMIKEHVLGSSSGKDIILLSKEPYLHQIIDAMTLYYPESCDKLLVADAELRQVQDRKACIRRIQELVLTGVFVLRTAEIWYIFGPVLDTSISCYEDERQILLSDSGIEIAKREHLQISRSAVSAYLITGLPFEPFQNYSFWDEIRKKYAARVWSGNAPTNEYEKAIVENNIGEYGVCVDDVGCGKFRYFVAGIYKGGNVPEGMSVYELPDFDWAVFDCYGPCPKALQDVNTKIWKEWLPGNPDFEFPGRANIEWYGDGDPSASDYHSAIWIPVKKK